MNNTGNKKSGYLVALLLMVGLVAFSNSMRELAEIHRCTLDTSRLIAQYMAPAEIPQIPQTPQAAQVPQIVLAKLESCESRQAAPSPVKVERVTPRVRVIPTEVQLAKLDKLKPFEFHPTPFGFSSMQFEFKAKNRKQNVIKFNTRDREMILRTLNRSINLRTAS
jgi:hypothetical protein